jgi:hypothetical protein
MVQELGLAARHMAITTCIKCSGHSFELSSFAPIGESHKVAGSIAVISAKCSSMKGRYRTLRGTNRNDLKNPAAQRDAKEDGGR